MGFRLYHYIRTVSYTHLYGDRYMIDFGQNMAGWVRINIAKAAAGDTICIRYAEQIGRAHV